MGQNGLQPREIILDTTIKIMNALQTLMKEITSTKVILIFFLGISLVALSFTYENRQDIFTRVISSPYLLVGGTSGILTIALGFMFGALVKRADERNEAMFTLMQQQISQLTVQLDDCLEREKQCTKNFNALLLKLGISQDD